MKRPHIGIAVGLIRLYRVVFFWLPSQCRIEPSCSRYTEQAIRKYGLIKGSTALPPQCLVCYQPF